MNRFSSIVLLLICFLAFSAGESRAAAGDTVHQTTYNYYPTRTTDREITDAQWKELTNDDHLGYKNEIEKKAEKKEKAEPYKKSLLEKFFDVLFSKEGKYIMWAIVFLVLGYAIFKFIVGEKSFMFARDKKQVVTDDTTTTEEDLLEVNWEQKLHEMINRGELRLAIRYSYMWMLQMLQEKALINYRIDKTNYEYAAELKDGFKQPFRQLTRQYEYAWYGQYPVSEESYNKFREEFIEIKKQINSH